MHIWERDRHASEFWAGEREFLRLSSLAWKKWNKRTFCKNWCRCGENRQWIDGDSLRESWWCFSSDTMRAARSMPEFMLCGSRFKLLTQLSMLLKSDMVHSTVMMFSYFFCFFFCERKEVFFEKLKNICSLQIEKIIRRRNSYGKRITVINGRRDFSMGSDVLCKFCAEPIRVASDPSCPHSLHCENELIWAWLKFNFKLKWNWISLAYCTNWCE